MERKKGTLVGLPDTIESDLHLLGLKARPMEVALLSMSAMSFLCLTLLLEMRLKSSANGVVMMGVLPSL